MGNCQAAEAATVILHHPANNKIERIYWSVSAHEIMTSNPGHYVALVVTSPNLKTENGAPVKQLKLLRPDDTLLIGQVYRLISFEDVLKEFAAKKSVKLGRLLRDRGGLGLELKKKDLGAPNPNSKSDKNNSTKMEHEEAHRVGSSSSGGGSSSSRGMARSHGGVGQWRPALQSIAELGT